MAAHEGAPAETDALVQAMIDAINADRLDEADTLFAKLCDVNPAARDVLIFPTLIAIRRGHALDALHRINGLPEGTGTELKALCLYALGDPTWHRYAEEKADDPDPYVREAMRHLLGRVTQAAAARSTEV